MTTIAEKIHAQRAALIGRLEQLDPDGVVWAVGDTYRELLDTFFYLTDRATVAR